MVNFIGIPTLRPHNPSIKKNTQLLLTPEVNLQFRLKFFGSLQVWPAAAKQFTVCAVQTESTVHKLQNMGYGIKNFSIQF